MLEARESVSMSSTFCSWVGWEVVEGGIGKEERWSGQRYGKETRKGDETYR